MQKLIINDVLTDADVNKLLIWVGVAAVLTLCIIGYVIWRNWPSNN